MLFFDPETVVDIYYDATEQHCVGYAVRDLAGDMAMVGALSPTIKTYLPREEHGCIVIGSLENTAFRDWLAANKLDCSTVDGESERYILRTYGQDNANLLICGSDKRGAMWGIYEICETVLGVDPLYFWTDNPPQVQMSVSVDRLDITSESPTYRFRGWFLNDEDLLTEWENGGGKRYIDYPYYAQVTHQSVFARVLEAMLRLRQNLVIPASFIDIDNPAEENLVRMASERGLWVTQHHVEPMGVSHFGWENYWQARGREVPASFVQYPDEWIEIWTYYAGKWAQYGDVIWQFGLRGRGDRPVWVHDPSVSPSMSERGRLISDAYHTQADIVKKVTGHDDFIATATLWMEGSELMQGGNLAFPENTLVVFSDHGATQMMLDDFYDAHRQPEREYGSYFHVAFWSAGPRLVAGTSLDKLVYNYRTAVEKGDTAYTILNVGNIREFPIGIEAAAQMTWDQATFDAAAFLDAWLVRHFGADAVAAVRAIYDAHFAAYPVLDDSRHPEQRILLDGMVRGLGLKLLDYLQTGTLNVVPNRELGQWGADLNSEQAGSPAGFIAAQKAMLSAGITGWDRVQDRIYAALPQVKPDARQFFVDHFLVQLEQISGLYRWGHGLCCAAEAYLNANDPIPHLEQASTALQKTLLDRKKAEHDHWAHWYRGDKKMNLPDLLKRTQAHIQVLQGEPV